MGVGKIAEWLNTHGYMKKKRQNNTLDAFAASFIKGVIDNPVYCGKLAYGRRHNEKIPGAHNQYHIVKQDEYMLYDGEHEAIVSEELWLQAKEKRDVNGFKREKVHSLEHEHILSGIVKCPVCGSGMYGNVNRKKKPDGSSYKDYFYYQCKHRRIVDGHRCDYSRQWSEEIIDEAVAEVIRRLVRKPQFAENIQKKIGLQIDTGELEKELEVQRKRLRQLNGTKDRLSQQIDALAFDDPHYERKYQDIQERQDKIYDEIANCEVDIAEIQTRITNVRRQKISGNNVYQFLLYFDKLYDQFTDLEKKEFMKSFIENVLIYPEKQPNGKILRHIDFRFPVYFNGQEVDSLDWDNESTVETVCLLTHS